ncbi:MAG: hypothetical protein AAF213_13800 [Pseudomonadota bacterium]
MSAILKSDPIPQADMSVKPPTQDVVSPEQLTRYRATQAAKASNTNGSPAKSPLADMSFDAPTLDAANSGQGRMSHEAKTPAWEQPDKAGIAVTAGGPSTMNAMRASMGEEPEMKEMPAYTMNAVRPVAVHHSVEQESAMFSFFNNTGDTRSQTEVGSVKPEAEMLEQPMRLEQPGADAEARVPTDLGRWRHDRALRSTPEPTMPTADMSTPKPPEQRHTMTMGMPR